ncbi:MAG: thioesterase family protein [Anaerolineaceae bacterium]|jgi:YbgC/YbaW family acyl-CoA thioester hydrolase|nr:thioesterase family protein [Anaerolineaceae bacterium]MDD4043195.1 thioesterase family protein [Anaerolineaceae bacterium]MDD4577866.1 thioesterase family protein [Anaerolineaceae bacterium]
MTSIIPSYPQDFAYYEEIQVRYSDLDTLQHVNNVSILEYVEHARTGYYRASGIWDGTIREGFGMVVASVKIDYLASIQYGDPVRVGIKLAHIGSKSLRFRFQVENSETLRAFARGEVVMVAYDHTEDHSMPVSQEWREKLAAFENNQELSA